MLYFNLESSLLFATQYAPIFVPPWQRVDGFSDDLLLVDVPDYHLVVHQELVVAGEGGRDPGMPLPHVLLDSRESVPDEQPLRRQLIS